MPIIASLSQLRESSTGFLVGRILQALFDWRYISGSEALSENLADGLKKGIDKLTFVGCRIP
jgi:hypothetical protein